MRSIYSRTYKGIISLIIKDNIVTSIDIQYINKTGKERIKNILINNEDVPKELKEGQKVVFDDINDRIFTIRGK